MVAMLIVCLGKCVMAQDDDFRGVLNDGFRGVLNDNLRGVLNDWDLAADPSDLHAPTARTTPTTGTTPCLASGATLSMPSGATPSMPSGTTPLMPFGTPPFMAVDMLEEDALKVERLYRHDLESLFYVLTWAAYCYTDGRRCYEDGRRCCNDARNASKSVFCNRSRYTVGGTYTERTCVSGRLHRHTVSTLPQTRTPA